MEREIMGIFIAKHKKFNKTVLILIFITFLFFPTNIMKGDVQKNQTIFIDDNIVTPDWYNKPDSYAELVEWYKALENNFPEYIEVFKANELYNTGKVDGGYDLYYVRITNETTGFNKPEVLFLGSPHGDETVGTIGLYWFTNWLMRMAYTDEPCKNYSKSWLRWLVDNREIYIAVSQNPYGFDNKIRYDTNNWDLNREADYDGPGKPTGGIWASVNGKTLREFVNHHLIRVGCDFHGGARAILYPWSSNHDNIKAVSAITGKLYTHVPPDFNYFDVSSLRLGNYMGFYGGIFNQYNIGTIPDTIHYEAEGVITSWAYGSDVKKHPAEDLYVNDETFGNYPGAGILWLSPEMSFSKNPSQASFGNDEIDRYGSEVRRFVLHQTDLAQPYVRWIISPKLNNTMLLKNESVTFRWQVNGSLVVDSTHLQYSDKNPIENPTWSSEDISENIDEYHGGTGWDNAYKGKTQGVTYEETVTFDEIGDYYIVARAKVDQIYKNVIQSIEYENETYLRIVNERTNSSFIETLNGTDGIERIGGRLWWYSPIIHISVVENVPEFEISKPENAIYFNNKEIIKLSFIKNPIIIGKINVSINVLGNDSSIRDISFYIDDHIRFVDGQAPYFFIWDEKAMGMKSIKIVVNCDNGCSLIEKINVWKFF